MMPEDAKPYLPWIQRGIFGLCVLSFLVRAFFPFSNSRSLPLAALDLLAGATGGLVVFYGFGRLREKRLMDNIPASKVRSVAMGFAEISGRAQEKLPLVSPITGFPSVYYRYLIEEERSGSRNRGRWVTIDSGQSTQPFYLKDETGQILVDPREAETVLRQTFRSVRRGEGWLGRRQRLTEWSITPGQKIFVVGTVGKTTDVIFAHRAQLVEALQGLKHDPARMKEVDTDHDGQISPEEWQAAVAKARDDLLRQEVARQASEPPDDDLALGKGADETTFVISDRSEASLSSMLAWKAGASLLFGPAVLILMVMSLLARSGLFPAHFAFPWESLFR